MKKTLLSSAGCLIFFLVACGNEMSYEPSNYVSERPSSDDEIANGYHDEQYDYHDVNYSYEDTIDDAVSFDPSQLSFDITILEDFLSKFVTIFSEDTIGWKDMETGIVYNSYHTFHTGQSWIELQPIDKLPLITFGGERSLGNRLWDENRIWLDGETIINQAGELIIEAPFIFGRRTLYDYQNDSFDTTPTGVTVAWQFDLFDLFEDEIPAIIIHPIHLQSNNFGFPAPSRLYWFIDGEFRHIYTFITLPTFWRDENGQLVLHSYRPLGNFEFYYLTVNNGVVQTEMMVELPEPAEFEDLEYLRETTSEILEALTPIPSLMDLSEYITVRVRKRLGLTE